MMDEFTDTEQPDEVLNVYLGNKHIEKIELLDHFKSLKKLDLCNNSIEKIQGLDSLINLNWLDLSFNKIQKIEGLDALQKLEVLNLSNNSISVIENIDALKNLSHFFIENNLIKELKSVLQLGRCKTLFELSFSGNLVTKEEGYVSFLMFILPNLNRLDNTYIGEKNKGKLSVKCQSFIEEMHAEELQRQQTESLEKDFEDALAEDLNGSRLFKSMFDSDPEGDKIHSIPRVALLLQTFEDQTVELCSLLSEVGSAEHKQREAELSSYFKGQNMAQSYYREKVSQILAEFDKKQEGTAQLLAESDIDAISQSLMAQEFQLFKDLEVNIQLLVDSLYVDFKQKIEATFAQLQELETNYHQNLEEIAKENETVEPTENEPDGVMTTLNTSHVKRLQKIIDKENQLGARVDIWKLNLHKEIKEKIIQQHRMHLLDIQNYTDYLRKLMEDMQ